MAVRHDQASSRPSGSQREGTAADVPLGWRGGVGGRAWLQRPPELPLRGF